MLSLEKLMATESRPFDRFRGTTQRWTIEAGPLAGTAFDLAFYDDWSLSWRTVAGPSQGQVGRIRQFQVQPVRADLYLLSYETVNGGALTVAIDFRSARLVGFKTAAGSIHPLSGTIRML